MKSLSLVNDRVMASSKTAPVAITGVGAVCGAGRTIESIWDAIVGGRSAVTSIAQWDTSHWPVRVAAEVTGVENRTLVEDRKLHKLISRTDFFGLYAAEAAVRKSGLLEHRKALEEAAGTEFNDRSAVFTGSGGGNYNSNYDFFPVLTAAGGSLEAFGREVSNSVSPMWLLQHLPNNVLCHVGIRYNFKGANGCVTNQCVGGALAAMEAAAALRTGEADRALAVGHDAPIEPETVFHYHRLGLLAQDAVRPFDERRSGTVFGEGAAALVLERGDQAQARGAAIVGDFLGAGCITEGTGILDVRPDGDGPRRAIEMALGEAELSPGDIGMIVAHGNGTQASDASEGRAIARVFGGEIPPVTAFKWAIGHLIAASGLTELVLALTALRGGIVPGIPTLKSLDPNLPTLPVSGKAQKPRSNIGLILCRGFAGMNVALVVRAE